MSTDDLSGLLTGVPSGKADFATEDSVKLIASASESLESQLVQALADTERVRMLARRATEQTDLVAQLEAQVLRAMEREDLLRNQLASKDIEVDEIYNVSSKSEHDLTPGLQHGVGRHVQRHQPRHAGRGSGCATE